MDMEIYANYPYKISVVTSVTVTSTCCGLFFK